VFIYGIIMIHLQFDFIPLKY